MKKFASLVLCAVFATAFGPAPAAFAQSGTPSAKASVQVSDTILVADTAGLDFTPILSTSIKTSEQKDLLMGVSLETVLYTQTLVKSKGGSSDTSFAEARILIQVLVDGQRLAEPGLVVFDKRSQSLMAKFNGICADQNGDNIVQYSECQTPEELELILDTQAAHHFNFVLDDLGSGVHTIEVQAAVVTDTSAQAGSSSARAAIGKGSLTVEEIRMVKDVDFTK